jgi:hypothetical protein
MQKNSSQHYKLGNELKSREVSIESTNEYFTSRLGGALELQAS